MPAKRQSNFELLRIVAMFMIIALHYLVKGNVAAPWSESRTLVNYTAWLVEAFCIVAVNCYVLLSGYFLVESEWKPGRALSLLFQVLFYSLAVPAAMLGIGMISLHDMCSRRFWRRASGNWRRRHCRKLLCCCCFSFRLGKRFFRSRSLRTVMAMTTAGSCVCF